MQTQHLNSTPVPRLAWLRQRVSTCTQWLVHTMSYMHTRNTWYSQFFIDKIFHYKVYYCRHGNMPDSRTGENFGTIHVQAIHKMLRFPRIQLYLSLVLNICEWPGYKTIIWLQVYCNSNCVTLSNANFIYTSTLRRQRNSRPYSSWLSFTFFPFAGPFSFEVVVSVSLIMVVVILVTFVLLTLMCYWIMRRRSLSATSNGKLVHVT